MAGVAGPMLRRSKWQGTRFLLGLLAGGVLSSALLATAVFGVGISAQWLLPRQVRWVLFAVILLVLGVADLANRTPHVWRQVPQAYVRSLPPGRLGTVWGFDLSLLFTTQKSTSLTWAALAGAALLAPSASWVMLIGMTAVGVLTIAVRSVSFAVRRPSWRGDRGKPWFAQMRRASGVALFVAAVIAASR